MTTVSRWLPVLALLALSGTAFAQMNIGTPKPVQPQADPNTREVPMVRQDFSDCQNASVSAQDPSRIGGSVFLKRGNDGKTQVKVVITASRDTRYHVFLKCVRLLGDIKTDDEGTGIGVFSFGTGETGATYAFDMYPEGAPAGNKFQSVQVKY